MAGAVEPELLRQGGKACHHILQCLIVWLALSCMSMSASRADGQQKPRVSGWVQTLIGERLPGVEVRMMDVGGSVTSDTGEFSIGELPPNVQPGQSIILFVKHQEWVIASPYEGRTQMPQPGVSIQIVVARRKDIELLRSRTSRTVNAVSELQRGMAGK
jgi:hypothetical protein